MPDYNDPFEQTGPVPIFDMAEVRRRRESASDPHALTPTTDRDGTGTREHVEDRVGAGMSGGGLSAEERESLWQYAQTAPSNHDRPQIAAAVERIVAAREAKARAETGEAYMRTFVLMAQSTHAARGVEVEDAREQAAAWESGVRQAMEWLQADYPPFDGPEWRERGVEWIAARLAEHRADRLTDTDPPT